MLIVLTALGALSFLYVLLGNYSPSTMERATRHKLVTDIQSALRSVPPPVNSCVATVRRSKTLDIRYWGNYWANNAFLDVRYYTDESPEAACKLYLSHVKSRRNWQVVGSMGRADTPCQVRYAPDTNTLLSEWQSCFLQIRLTDLK